MKKWRYKIETFIHEQGVTADSAREMQEVLNQYGEKGWELVSILPTHYTITDENWGLDRTYHLVESVMITFKRKV